MASGPWTTRSKEITSTPELPPSYSTAFLTQHDSTSQLEAKNVSAPHSDWSLGRSLPPLHLGIPAPTSSKRPAAPSSYLPALGVEPHIYEGMSASWSVEEHPDHPNKRRRLEELVSEHPANRSAAFADSPGPRGQAVLEDPSFRLPGASSFGSQIVSPRHFREKTVPELHSIPASRNAYCCPSGCPGVHCRSCRTLVHEILTELADHEVLLHNATGLDCRSPDTISSFGNLALAEALEWVLDRLKCNTAVLRQALSTQRLPLGGPATADRLSPVPAISRQTRNQNEAIYTETAGILTPRPTRPSISCSVPSFSSGFPTDEFSRSQEAMEPPAGPSFRQRTSSHGSASAMPQLLQSPIHVPLSARMLPSPTSLNLPVPPGMASPSLAQNAAQAAHFQDLQHQVTVKSLALQTLQREYDSLLQKLERQRTKCATLEKKFHVSDAELNGLTNDKERLETQVATLEKQVEDAQNARDEARKTGAEQSAQYMKMIELAGRLQSKTVEDRKTWEQEKTSLIERVKQLELGSTASQAGISPEDVGELCEEPPAEQSTRVTTGAESLRADEAEGPGRSSAAPNQAFKSASVDEEQIKLRTEVAALKERVAGLEAALTVARDECRVVREAALTLAACGQRTETAVEKALPARPPS